MEVLFFEKMVNNAGVYYHSVTLDEEKCKGCTNCIKRCPAEAIRVRMVKHASSIACVLTAVNVSELP